MKKLDEIRNYSRRAKAPEEPRQLFSNPRGGSPKQRPRGYAKIDRDMRIQLNNQKLLDKLVEISTGKHVDPRFSDGIGRLQTAVPQCGS